MIHTIRQVINDDEKFRQILRGLNKDFYHQTVTSKMVEEYISQRSGINFSKVFDQYLRTTQIPVLELKTSAGGASYRWTNCIEGFDMPVKLTDGTWLKPTTDWQEINKEISSIAVNKNFYINTRKI